MSVRPDDSHLEPAQKKNASCHEKNVRLQPEPAHGRVMNAPNPHPHNTLDQLVSGFNRIKILLATALMGAALPTASVGQDKPNPFATQVLPNAERYIQKPERGQLDPQSGSSAATSKPKLPSAEMSENQIQAKALFDLAELLDAKGDPGALEAYEKAAQAGSHWAYYQLALDAKKAGNQEAAIEFYKKGAQLGSAASCHSLGDIYREKGQLQQALAWYKKGADMNSETDFKKGNCPGTIMALTSQVAGMYSRGEGTPKNAAMALQYYNRGGFAEEGEIMLDIADVYFRVARSESDPEKAAELRTKGLEAAAKSGFDTAGAVSAWEATKSGSSGSDKEKIVRDLRQAAKLEYPDALIAYSKILLNGPQALVEHGMMSDKAEAGEILKKLEISRNPDRAIEYLNFAAEQGYALAAFQLGNIYLKGEAVRRNRTKAFDYFQKAADWGHAESGVEIAKLLEAGIGADRENNIDLNAVLLKAAEAGNAEAMYKLAMNHATGNGVEPKASLATKYLEQAAAAGHQEARKLILKAFLNPREWDNRFSIDTKKPEIFEYAQDLAEKGDKVGRLALAQCYQQGLGTPKNPAMAEQLLREVTGISALGSQTMSPINNNSKNTQ